MIIIDTTGLSCPQPVLMVKNALDKKQEGTIKVIADNEASRENITRFANSQGWEKTAQSSAGEVWTLQFSKSA